MRKILILFFLISVVITDIYGQECKAQNAQKRNVCYFANWSQYRSPPANMKPEDFDPCVCTHVLYSFVPMSNNALAPGADDTDYFKRMAEWKKINPNIKISMSVGGWNEGSTNFNSISSTDANRQTFCQSVIDISRQYNLDGIDIDWEYPQVYQKSQYSEFIKKCHDMFVAEAAKSGKPKLLLSAATAPDSTRMQAYDLPVLNNYFDMVNPMTYDMHGSWDGNNGHHSPLLGPDGAATALENYIKAGISPSKLNMGLAGYGRTRSVGGQYTREPGVLSYFEICQSKTNYRIDDYTKAPSATVNGETCYYEDTTSIAAKADWALSHGIGGTFIWDASLDDFRGTFCSEGKFPLITTALNKMNGGSVVISPHIEQAVIEPVGPSTTVSASSSSSSNLAQQVKGCNGASGIVPHPTDCSKFIQCTSTSEIVLSCGSGLMFNPKILSCDWASNVQCNSVIAATTTTVELKTTTTTTTTVADVASSTTTTQQSASATKEAKFDCSLSGLNPHPTDCSKYYQCVGETVYITQCGGGLNFDPVLKLCNFSSLVKCNV